MTKPTAAAVRVAKEFARTSNSDWPETAAEFEDAASIVDAEFSDVVEALNSIASSFETCLQSPPSRMAVWHEITEFNLKFARAALAKLDREQPC